VWLPTFRREACRRSVDGVTVYLLEAYLGRSQSGELAGIAKRLRKAAQGQPVRYVRSTYVPEDETCFHYVEAHSVSAAEALARRAQLTFDRILEARSAAVSSETDSKAE
jgi:hypothetical protein